MKNYHIAVLDIGKTNKKVFIYNDQLKLIDSAYQSFPEIKTAEFQSDDVEGMFEWFKQTIKQFSEKYQIKAISISTHGATFACVDQNGQLSVPQVSYTHEPGENFHREFFNVFGDPEVLQQETATPNFPALLNVAKGLYFIKSRYPEQFEKTKYVLNLPQYFGFLLTKNPGAEPTYVGCHSYLWDFHKKKWSSVAEKMGISGKLPKNVSKTWDILGFVDPKLSEELGISRETIVTMGIHDSNASLLPYTIAMERDFVLNSTGTWCVVMHEEDKVAFEEDELGKIVFYNLNVFDKPVKTAIFLGGLEFETYTDILKKINKRSEFPAFNKDLYNKITKESKDFILPSVTKGTGQFPDSDPKVIEGDNVYSLADIQNNRHIPEFFNDYEYAYAVLNISLAIQTKVALERTGARDGVPVFTEGGFRKNDSYNMLLTAFYPNSEIATTNLEEATAFGTAMIAKAAYEYKSPEKLRTLFTINKNVVEKVLLENLDGYYRKFMKLV